MQPGLRDLSTGRWGLLMAPIRPWKKHNIKNFHAAFVFMDEATRPRLTAKMTTTDTPRLATRISTTSDSNVVFAHALVGPSDLLVGVKGGSPAALVKTIQTKIRKNVDRLSFVHRIQSHIVISSEGRIDFSKEAFHRQFSGDGKANRPMRAWILATAAEPNLRTLTKSLRKNPQIMMIALVLGRYDYFIFVEAEDMKAMQAVVDKCVRGSEDFVTTDTRIVMQE
jgi:hypothetical protein